MTHWIIAPILIPALAGLLLLLEVRERHRLRRVTGLLATIALVPVALMLWQQAAQGNVGVYQLGDWQAPFGIVLVLDQLSALMLLLTAVLALPALLYGCGGDDRRGPNFHSLFQFQLMGINGAFLTGDLFNLFVFFEVLLIASYGLALHGRGPERVKAGLHYVVLNLTGSALFLIALGLIYGTTGTLNMADFAVKAQALEGSEQTLLTVAVLLLWVVFGLKAALFPLYFWLPAAYANATAPVAALFAIMTKVGIYAILRMQTLAFSDGPLAGLGADLLWWLALVTLALAAIGALAARRLGVLVAYLVVMSVGSLVAALSFGAPQTVGPALYYLIHSTLICAALFLLCDLLRRSRGDSEDRLESGPPLAHGNWLGAAFFAAAVAVIGLPPLSGFVGKVSLLQAVPSAPYWALLLLAGLAGLVGLSRAGSTLFWRVHGEVVGEKLGKRRVIPMLALLLASPLLTLAAEPMLQLCGGVATQLADPTIYIRAVLGGAS